MTPPELFVGSVRRKVSCVGELLEKSRLSDGYKWLTPAIATRTKISPHGVCTLYDLRRLRFVGVTNPDSDWLRVIYGDNLLVLIPNLTP